MVFAKRKPLLEKIYSGEYWDADMAEYYLRARTYNPATGRFSQEDIAKDGTNWYAYCGSNPVTRRDPSGLRYDDGNPGDAYRQRKEAEKSRKQRQPANGTVADIGRTVINNVVSTVINTADSTVSNTLGSGGNGGSSSSSRPMSVGDLREQHYDPQAYDKRQKLNRSRASASDYSTGAPAWNSVQTNAPYSPVTRAGVLSLAANWLVELFNALKFLLLLLAAALLENADEQGNLPIEISTPAAPPPPDPEEGPSEIKFDDRQVGQKWGKHRTDYPELANYQEYKDLATEIFNNPDSMTVVGNEIRYMQGNNLLRTSLLGDFISLYPIT